MENWIINQEGNIIWQTDRKIGQILHDETELYSLDNSSLLGIGHNNAMCSVKCCNRCYIHYTSSSLSPPFPHFGMLNLMMF